MKIYSEIQTYKEEVVKIALGDFGISLLNFSKNIDQEHFGVSDVPITESLSNKILQILQLVNYAFENRLNDASNGISKFYKKNIPTELENIDKKFIRLIKNKEKREQARNNKKICDISLYKFYEKASPIWDNSPDDFGIYLRNSSEYKKMIQEAEVKAKRYKELGCEELYCDIINNIQEIEALMNDTYKGYHRISLRNSSVILAKINNYKLEKEIGTVGSYVIKSGASLYKPKAYPIKYLIDIATDKMNLLLEELEQVPLFDYYMVLVPSSKDSCCKKDIEDVKNKNLIPILIGEKDGKCYFISYWI